AVISERAALIRLTTVRTSRRPRPYGAGHSQTGSGPAAPAQAPSAPNASARRCSHAHRRRSSGAAGPFSKTVSTPWPASGDRHLGSSAGDDDILFVQVQELGLS